MATIYLAAKTGPELNHDQKIKLERNLNNVFGDRWRSIGNGNYLLAAGAGSITQDISDNLGISSGDVGGYIVTALAPYYGWSDNSNWEWIDKQRGLDENL